MKHLLSERINNLSQTLAMAAGKKLKSKERYYKFKFGRTRFNTQIQEAAKKAIDENYSHLFQLMDIWN
jgi:hypothetical protein